MSTPYRILIRLTFLILSIMVAQVLIPFINCRPFSKTWNPDPRYQGSCFIPGLALWRYLGIPNVFTTFIIVGIPLPALYHLHISRAMKAGLGVVFSVCILGVVAAVMRFRSFLAVNNFNDITYENVKPLCCTIAESGIYLVAGCMLGLRPLVKKVSNFSAFARLLNNDNKPSPMRSERVDMP
jgi:hypothetical protein